jgi:two-component system, OmpR family, phosphate regulon sensor histidine kinase PhoR
MRIRLWSVYVIAVATGLGILCFQLAWLRNAIMVTESNFYSRATIALERSVNLYLIRQNKNNEQSPLYYVNLEKAGPGDSIDVFPQSYKDPSGVLIHYKPKFVHLRTNDELQIALIMARIGLANSNDTISLTAISALYTQQISADEILQPFTLAFRSAWPSDERYSMVRIGYTESPMDIAAIFPERNAWLAKEMIYPFAISFSLILLTGGGLLYIGRNVWQQKKLDDIKNDFINNMTHELKTPIAILKATHEVLYDFDEINDRDKTKRYLQLNITELNRLEENVSRVLDITRYENGNVPMQLSCVNLNSLVTAVITKFATISDTRFITRFNGEITSIKTDAHAIETILHNLIDNAIKYNHHIDALVKVSVTARENSWTLFISDNGDGIPKHHLPYIFDKFYRVPTGNVHTKKGYGLGLSYSRILVQGLGGTIDVQNAYPTGTLFIIEFPFK